MQRYNTFQKKTNILTKKKFNIRSICDFSTYFNGK